MEHTIEVHWPDGSQQSLSRLWLRDNCRCPECRIAQTEEKQFQLASLEDTDYEATILADDKALHITWGMGIRAILRESSLIAAIKYPRSTGNRGSRTSSRGDLISMHS